jgi:hypothetical protein
MVWKILRPYYWMLDRKVRALNKMVVVIVVTLVGIGGQWLYNTQGQDYLARLGSEEVGASIASFLPLGLGLFLLFALLGLGDMMGQLYLASDLELLIIAPIPNRTIFVVKLLQCSRATWGPGLACSAFLLALATAQKVSPLTYPLVLTLMVGTMTLTTALVMGLVILLARFIPPQKVRSWIPVAATLTTTILALSSQWIAQWLLTQSKLTQYFSQVFFNVGQLTLLTGGMSSLALMATLGVYQIFNIAFYEGWNRFREVPTQRTNVSASRDISRWVQVLPSPLRQLLIKEWLQLRRDPRNLLNLVQPFMPIIMVLVLFWGAGRGNPDLRPLLFWFILIFLPLFLAPAPIGTSLMSVAQEGDNIDLLRSTPTLVVNTLRAKFLATWVPMALIWSIGLIFAGLVLRLSLGQTIFLVTSAVLGLAGASAVTTAIGGLLADFSVAQVKQRIPTYAGYLVMGVNLAFVLLTMVMVAGLGFYLFPASSETIHQMLTAYSDESQTSIAAGILLAPVNLHLLFWVGVKLLWDAAIRRLEHWERT